MPIDLESPRVRRRLLWLGGLLLAAAAVALAIVLIPQGKPSPNKFSSAPVQIPVTPRNVPLTAADRRAIDAVLDRFVPAAVGRHDPGVAWALAAPALRAGTTREEWARGDVPTEPYPVHRGPTHEWVLQYSIPHTVALELGLRPAPRSTVGNAAYDVILRRIDGRWLVSAITQRTVYPATGGG